jgi:hypothetical protein
MTIEQEDGLQCKHEGGSASIFAYCNRISPNPRILHYLLMLKRYCIKSKSIANIYSRAQLILENVKFNDNEEIEVS